MRFTVQVRADGGKLPEIVDIFLDRDGLDDLRAQLGFLRQPGDHSHFFTEAWGGQPLTEDGLTEDGRLVHKLTIHLVEA